MREGDAFLVIAVAWMLVGLASLGLTIATRRAPAPSPSERQRLGAFVAPAVEWGGTIVWGLAALGLGLVVWWLGTGQPLPKATVWLMVTAWAGLFLPSWSALWVVRRWLDRGGRTDVSSVRRGEGVSAAGSWLVGFFALSPAAVFVGLVVASGPLRALRVLGFGVGLGVLGLLAAVATLATRERTALAALFASWAMFGISALSYLFTRDVEGSIAKFSSASASVATTGTFLVLLYLVTTAMTALAVLPVMGARSADPASRRLYLIHVAVSLWSGFYLLPAIIATGLLTATKGAAASFETFWETHFFHTPWLLGWQLASWLVILLLVHRAMNEQPLVGDHGRSARARELPIFTPLATLLVLGTVTEAWRGFWWVWAGTAALFILLALDLRHTWR